MFGEKGGRFEFEDGGVYSGEWEEGKAHGYGVCTGPKGEGEYSGAYNYGFEVCGVYTVPRGGAVFAGQWQNGKKHGLGIEHHPKYVYRGEWNQGTKGRYGVRHSRTSQAKYEGTWSDGLQDGYGTETYADGGIYRGQWLRGMRHGYGIRKSVPYGLAAQFTEPQIKHDDHASCSSIHSQDHEVSTLPRCYNNRGGFVLRSQSTENSNSARRVNSEQSIARKRFRLRLMRKQRSADDVDHSGKHAPHQHMKGSGSNTSCTGSEEATGAVRVKGFQVSKDASFELDETIDPSVIETYKGEWKNDKRSGFGVSERTDGLQYYGEWFNNKKYGYGVTSYKDGTREEGKYRNNVLLAVGQRKNALFMRSSKMKERIEAAVEASLKASKIAIQKAEVAEARTSTAKDRAEQGDLAAEQAKEDSTAAKAIAHQFDASIETTTPAYLLTSPSSFNSSDLIGNDISHQVKPKEGIKRPSTLVEEPSKPHKEVLQSSFPSQFEAVTSGSTSDDSPAMFTPTTVLSPTNPSFPQQKIFRSPKAVEQPTPEAFYNSEGCSNYHSSLVNGSDNLIPTHSELDNLSPRSDDSVLGNSSLPDNSFIGDRSFGNPAILEKTLVNNIEQFSAPSAANTSESSTNTASAGTTPQAQRIFAQKMAPPARPQRPTHSGFMADHLNSGQSKDLLQQNYKDINPASPPHVVMTKPAGALSQHTHSGFYDARMANNSPGFTRHFPPSDYPSTVPENVYGHDHYYSPRKEESYSAPHGTFSQHLVRKAHCPPHDHVMSHSGYAQYPRFRPEPAIESSYEGGSYSARTARPKYKKRPSSADYSGKRLRNHSDDEIVLNPRLYRPLDKVYQRSLRMGNNFPQKCYLLSRPGSSSPFMGPSSYSQAQALASGGDMYAQRSVDEWHLRQRARHGAMSGREEYEIRGREHQREPLLRKGSLPDLHALSKEQILLSREEASFLSSQRRRELHEIRLRNERMKANPVLYLQHPQVKVSNKVKIEPQLYNFHKLLPP